VSFGRWPTDHVARHPRRDRPAYAMLVGSSSE
jgi:hypothetical protein